MGVPFVDLKAQYAAIKDEVHEAMNDVIANTAFIGGPAVARFEENFAKYMEAKYCVGTSSGTSALHLAFTVLGIGAGDEVIAPANTFIATTEAITHTGAKVVFVDVVEETQLIDAARIEEAVTPRTKAIVPVHLYGQPCDMDAVWEVARRHGLKIVADASQSHGATFNGTRKSQHGHLTTFSFYPGKNLGAYGDAGAIITDDEELANKARALGNHGRTDKYFHFAEGWNYRLDALHAAVLDVKLRHIEAWSEARRRHAARYHAGFADHADIVPIQQDPRAESVFHLYVVRVPDREKLGEELRARGIASGVHYPVPLHLQPAYEYLGYQKGSFPVTEKVVPEIISLPMYAELTDKMVDEVIEAVKDIVVGSRA